MKRILLLITIIKALSASKFFWIMLILVALLELKYSSFRGFMGELHVKQELKKLPKDKYKVLNDIMLLVIYGNQFHNL